MTCQESIDHKQIYQVPVGENPSTVNIEYYENFISKDEEKFIYDLINSSEWSIRGKRRMQTYGFQYLKGAHGAESMLEIKPIPSELKFILDRLFSLTHVNFNQMTVNEYMPGIGIDSHYDHKTRFGNLICGITLNGGCNMKFDKINSSDSISQYLNPCSIYLMKNELRYDWTHGIKGLFSDTVNSVSGETITIPRTKRISLTFRTVEGGTIPC